MSTNTKNGEIFPPLEPKTWERFPPVAPKTFERFPPLAPETNNSWSDMEKWGGDSWFNKTNVKNNQHTSPYEHDSDCDCPDCK